ncbi:hypothetical protein PACTADRAFT_50232 [Pachysolen tannophilus NRRL Y-2460]|uniref:Uncharacterized protein n=1 Tax=Pachysolen tannophilus NRRL Y-2460 TaxID=669874 RepID=A0A1E4TV35_PACTA|nr:hypothetical protein PACTADRAFT_50232 [Pachysolen tannophilus NRRL Y-2460]
MSESEDVSRLHGEEVDEGEEGEGYLSNTEVEEEINAENDAEPMSDEGEDDDHDENLVEEIDMSNNSWTYFDTHKDSVFTVFSHPTLPLVVTGGADNTAYVWVTHLQPPKLVTEITGHKESVITGGFTNDGEYMVTGDMAGKIQIFKSLKRGQKWELVGSLEEISEVTWIKVHPKQQIFAFGGSDGSVWCYQIAPEIAQLMSGFSHQLDCSNGEFIDIDNQDALTLVTVSEDGSIISWNGFTGEVNWKIQSSDLKGLTPPWVSISKEEGKSNILAIGARDAHLAIINGENGNILNLLKAIELKEDQDEFESSIETITWCSVLPILAVGLVSGDVILFDTKSWRPRRNIKIDDAVTKLQFINKSTTLVGSSMNGKIYKWDSRTGEELFVGVGHSMGILDFALQDNGNKLITAGDEGVSLIFVAQ